MDRKQVEEIIKKDFSLLKGWEYDLHCSYRTEAKGFLNGSDSERKRAKKLDMTKAFTSCKRWKVGDGVCCACVDLYFSRLSQWKKGEL